eukprot:TRINITY_DN5217_c0_g1_i4.p1 TRINITY_DN5217_c0_g1~~TRINITY_DN5217_c0_g1_i4.p1  ORF type:complete len:243 (-),score=28.12 TRINITY_DN5217_c0_g1_i4:1-729(-)
MVLLLCKEVTLQLFKLHLTDPDFRFVAGCYMLELFWHHLQAFSYFSILNVPVYVGFIAIKCTALFLFPLMQTPFGVALKDWVNRHVLRVAITPDVELSRAQRASMLLFLTSYTQILAHLTFLLQITLFRFLPQTSPMFFFRDFSQSQYERTVIFVAFSTVCLSVGFMGARALLRWVHDRYHAPTIGKFPDPIEAGEKLFQKFRSAIFGASFAAACTICLMCSRYAQVFFYFFSDPTKFLSKS